jgi:hypothetical protein
MFLSNFSTCTCTVPKAKAHQGLCFSRFMNLARFKASSKVWVTQPFLWDITQHVLVFTYGRFVTSQRSNSPRICTTLPSKIGTIGCPETSVTTNLWCITSQKSEDLIHLSFSHLNYVLCKNLPKRFSPMILQQQITFFYAVSSFYASIYYSTLLYLFHFLHISLFLYLNVHLIASQSIFLQFKNHRQIT